MIMSFDMVGYYDALETPSKLQEISASKLNTRRLAQTGLKAEKNPVVTSVVTFDVNS